MDSRIFKKWGWLYIVGVLFIGLCQIDTMAEIIGGDNPWQKDKRSYRPYPILFLHGFAGGSNYTWNPDPNAKNQSEEQKKPTVVLEKYFRDYFPVNKALNNLTQFSYLETIEFFNSKSSNADQLMDRNSSVDRFKIGDYYVEHGVWWHKKQEGDPGWADKVSYALRGEPIHDLSKYLYDTGAGGGPVLKNYLPPNATSFKSLLVCHSMGGLSAREYLTNKTFYPGGEGSVDRLITIDTPHLGSALAVLADATVEVQRIATAMSITQPALVWLMAIPPAIEGIDNGLQLFSNIDIDGDAVNDMDPLSLLERFGSGFLGQLNARTHPQGVQYYIVYGSLPFAQIIDGFSIQGFINSLMDKGISIEEIEELLEKEHGVVEIGIGEIIATGIGDGVVSEPSQRGILKEENGIKVRVFEIAKESIKGIPTEIGIEAGHIGVPQKAVEIETDDVPPLLKLIDYTKPRLEITKPQEGFVWERGTTITLEGKVYDEYLPADSSLKIELYKAGDNFNPVFSEERKPDPITGYTPLKPTTLWRANDSNTPVAEFQEDVILPSGTNPEATYTIKLTVINPAGISSEPKQVTEKTWFMHGVGMGDSGEAKLWCMDGPTSFADGVAAIVSEFSLVDETGYNISARPLDIATSGNTIWISFDNRRIYSYNITTMKPNQLLTGKYYTTTGTPDGLYYDGNLQYCSSIDNKLYRINLGDGTEDGLGVVSRRLALDGVATDSLSVNYTTQEYTGYSPRGISARYLCSSKISKRDGQNFIQTLPTNTPVWMNEQESPASSLGIVEVADNTVPEGHVVYLSATDGNIYKVRFEDKISISRLTWPNIPFYKYWLVPDLVNLGTRYVSFYPTGMGYGLMAYPGVYEAGGTIAGTSSEMGDVNKIQIGHLIFRLYGTFTPPSNFIKAVAVSEGIFTNYRMELVSNEWYEWDTWMGFCNRYSQSGATISTCESLQGSADEQFNTPLIAHLWTQPYNATLACVNTISSTVTVVDVTNTMPRTDFTYTIRYDNEGQDLSVNSWQFFPSASMGDIAWGRVSTSVRNINLSFLTNNGSLEIIDQFSMASGVAEGIAIGSKLNIRIEPQNLSFRVGQTGQLKVNGKGPYTWSSSDDTVCGIEGDGEIVRVKAVGVGTATITVQDSLGNIAKATVNVSAF